MRFRLYIKKIMFVILMKYKMKKNTSMLCVYADIKGKIMNFSIYYFIEKDRKMRDRVFIYFII